MHTHLDTVVTHDRKCVRGWAGLIWRSPGCVTLAESETRSQFPPTSRNLPHPIWARISSGVSSGPLAKGLNLKDHMTSVKDHMDLMDTINRHSLHQHLMWWLSCSQSFESLMAGWEACPGITAVGWRFKWLKCWFHKKIKSCGPFHHDLASWPVTTSNPTVIH